MKRSRTGVVGALLWALVLGAIAAPSAQAGSYDVWSCRGPAGEPLAAAGWALTTRNTSLPGDVLLEDTCAAGGALTLSLDGTRPLSGQPRGTLTFAPPADSAIVGYTLWRSLYAPASGPGFAYTFTSAVKERTAVAESASGCASTLMLPDWNCSVEGSLSDPDGAGNRLQRSGLQLDGVQLEVACIAATCDEPFANRPATAKLYRAVIELDDSVAPDPPALSGTLTEAPAVDRRGTLVVESVDDGGGIAATTLSVDGGPPVASAPAGARGSCLQPYTVARPCPAAAARLFTVDTSGLSAGGHTLAGEVVDAAGNATPYGPLPFTVAHPGAGTGGDGGGTGGGTIVPVPPAVQAPAGNGTPAVRTPQLTLDRRELSRAGSRPALLTGTLRTSAGQPISGATLTVSTRALGTVSGRARALRSVVTGADGRFAVSVAGSGAERVELAFAPTADGADTARAAAIVRAAATLTARRSRARLRRGQAIVIAGRLDGAGAAARGAVVELQAIVRGGWRTVGTVRTGADGRYRWRYRFVNVTRDTIFSFRALVRETPGWPWPQLTTRTVLVRVDAA